jgi:hypothetical protein
VAQPRCCWVVPQGHARPSDDNCPAVARQRCLRARCYPCGSEWAGRADDIDVGSCDWVGRRAPAGRAFPRECWWLCLRRRGAAWSARPRFRLPGGLGLAQGGTRSPRDPRNQGARGAAPKGRRPRRRPTARSTHTQRVMLVVSLTRSAATVIRCFPVRARGGLAWAGPVSRSAIGDSVLAGEDRIGSAKSLPRLPKATPPEPHAGPDR